MPTDIRTYLFDTSALTKRYVTTEVDAGVVESICSQSGAVVAFSRFGQTELFSALSRRLRFGEMSEEEYLLILELYGRHVPEYAVALLTERVLGAAEDLFARHGLRAGDAVHVATGLTLQESGLHFRFVTADRRQAVAAEAERLDVWFLDGASADAPRSTA